MDKSKTLGQFNSSELIVNNEPDVPLRVPLENASIIHSTKIEMMKKRNHDRKEHVVSNLQLQAEQTKKEHMDRLKKKRKLMKAVEENYRDELKYQKKELQERKNKYDSIIENKRKMDKRREFRALKEYREHIQEVQHGQLQASPILQKTISNLKSSRKPSLASFKPMQTENHQYSSVSLDPQLEQLVAGKLEQYSKKQERSTTIYREKLNKIKEEKQRYNQKIAEIRNQVEEKQINQQTSYGRYVLPHYWDEDLTRKGNEAKNLKEFVVL